jgi:hypothetical protein
MGGGHEGAPWHRRSVARPPRLPTHHSTPIDAPTATTHRMPNWHSFSLPRPLRATMVWDNGAPAVGTSCPRVLDNTRLIGVPQEDGTSGRSRITSSVRSPSDSGLGIVLHALFMRLTFPLDFGYHGLLLRGVRDMATLETLIAS